jgi:nuclear transport factor 2 (NTF2) superfamily protein
VKLDLQARIEMILQDPPGEYFRAYPTENWGEEWGL